MNIQARIITFITLISIVFPFAGHITENTTFAQDTTFTGDVWIDPDVTLTIMPGVTIYITKVDQDENGIGDIDIFIEGRITAQGLEGQPVIFTSNEDIPAPQDWGGFIYTTDEDGELSTFSHTEILYAHEAFYINGRNVTFNNSRIAYASSYGVNIGSTIYTTSFNSTLIEDCGSYGVRIDNGTLIINDLNIMNNNGYGFHAGGESEVTLSTATIYNNNGYGLQLSGNVVIDAEDLNVSSNIGHGIEIHDNVTGEFSSSRFISNGYDGVWISSASPSFDNCEISNNNNDGVEVRDGSEATFTYCSIVENDNIGIYYSTGSNGLVTYSEILENGSFGVKIWQNSFPTLNYNHIYGNMGLENIENYEWFLVEGEETGWGNFSGGGYSDGNNYGYNLGWDYSPDDWLGYPRYIKSVTLRGWQTIGNGTNNTGFCSPDTNGDSCNGSDSNYFDGDVTGSLYVHGSEIFSTGEFWIDSWHCGDQNNCPAYYYSSNNWDCYHEHPLCIDIDDEFRDYYYYDFPVEQWLDNAGQMWTGGTTGPWAFEIVSYIYTSTSPSDQYQVVIDNADGTNLDLQNNWWDTINAVDDLVYQLYASSSEYEIILTEPIDPIGADLANIEPMISLLTPTVMELNPESVTLEWSDFDVDNDATISLYYDTGLDENGTLIVSGLSEDSNSDFYTWDFEGVLYDLYNIYAVIDDGDGGVDISYAPGQVMVGPLTVQVATDIIGVPGTQIYIPVEVINTIGFYEIISFQFTLAYNSDMVEAVAVSTADCLTENWTVFSNMNAEGQVTITGFPGDGVPLDNPGSADLVKISFNIMPDLDDYSTSPLNFADFTFNAEDPEPEVNDGTLTIIEQYNITGNAAYYMQYAGQDIPIENLNLSIVGEGLEEQSIVSTDSNGEYTFPAFLAGSYTVSASYDGDVGDLVITPYDASLTAQYSIFLYPFDSFQQSAADVNNDGNATTYDAALMAQYSVGLINEFAAGTWLIEPEVREYSLLNNFTDQEYQLIAVGDPSGNWGQFQLLGRTANKGAHIIDLDPVYNYITIPVEIDDSFQSIYIDVNYPDDTYEFVSFSKNDALSGFSESINDQPGQYRLSAFSMNEVELSDEAYSLVFRNKMKLRNNSTVFGTISVDVLVDEQPLNSGSQVLARGSYGEAFLPEEFALGNNYPNPFNPVTNFELSISEKKHVELIIYNIKGEQVDVLYSGVRDPGFYSISWDGSLVTSGIYIVRMVADGKLVEDRKITLLK